MSTDDYRFCTRVKKMFKKYVTQLKFADEALIDFGHRVAVVKTNMRKIEEDKYRKDAGTNIRLEEVRNWGRSLGGCTAAHWPNRARIIGIAKLEIFLRTNCFVLSKFPVNHLHNIPPC